MGGVLSFIGNVYTYAKAENNENVSIHNNFIKIPYVNDGRRYYILIPLELEHDKVRTISDLMDEKSNNEIFFNNILECIILTKDGKEIDVTTDIDRFMGPDQLYRDHSDVIKVSDVIDKKYHGDFARLKVMYDDLEYKYIESLDDLIFSHEEPVETVEVSL